MNNKRKALLISHTDLDGYGAALVVTHHFARYKTPVERVHLQNGAIDSFLENLIADKERLAMYSDIVITDIAPEKPETWEKLDNLYEDDALTSVRLFDHHASALENSKPYFKWAFVMTKYNERLTSGTQLAMRYYFNASFDEYFPVIEDFVHLVNLYDTWDWTRDLDPELDKEWANKLNSLFYLLGPKVFSEHMLHFFNDQTMQQGDLVTELKNRFELLLAVEEKQQKAYIHKKLEQVHPGTLTYDGVDYSVGYVFADQNISILGNAIAEEYDIAVISGGTKQVSLRSKHESLDLSVIAKHNLGGGGHRLSAGGFLPTSPLEDLERLFLFKFE